MKQSDPLLERIETAIAPTVNAMGLEVVRLQFVNGPKKTLQIMAENDEGRLGIDECAQLSQAISAILDVEDVIEGEYLLEVSSPGLDRPLTKADHFRRFLGHKAKIRLDRPLETGRRNFAGRLVDAGEDSVEIEIADPETGSRICQLPFDRIVSAHLVITDDLIKADLKRAKSG